MIKRLLKNHTFTVRPEAVEAMLKDEVYTHNAPEGVNTVVTVASLHGYELAVYASSCVDPRNQNMAVGSHYGRAEAKRMAMEALYNFLAIKLIVKLNDFQGTDEEFIEQHKDEFYFSPILPHPVYRAAKLTAERAQ